MKLIFVNRFFYPDHSATSQMLSDLAFGLAERGHKVAIITSRLRYDDATAALPPHETVHGAEVYRVWTSRFGRHVLAGRAIDYATFYLASNWAVLRLAQRNDIVVAKTDPPMLGIVIRWMAHLRGARFVNWLQDIFPEVALALGMNRRLARASFSLLRIYRDASLRAADANVAIGTLMAQRVRAIGVDPKRICTIPNWADTKSVRPVRPGENPLRSAWNLNDAFVVGYSGNLGRAHEIETLLDATTRTESAPSCAHVRWLFIGAGAQYEALKSECAARRLSTVQFQPYQPREELARSLSAADVHLVSLRPELEGLIVPSKIYGTAAAGRPVIFIGDKNGEIAQLLASNDFGVTIAQGDGAALAAEIIKLATDRTLAERLGANARSAAERSFGIPQALDAWEALIATLQTAPGMAVCRTAGHSSG